jgi:hypothetical protein
MLLRSDFVLSGTCHLVTISVRPHFSVSETCCRQLHLFRGGDRPGRIVCSADRFAEAESLP